MGVKDDIIPIYTSHKPVIEVLNMQVKKWADISSKEQIKQEIDDIIQIGMNQYYQKASQFPLDIFCAKLAELWNLYITNIIPTLQACLIPISDSQQVRKMSLLAFRNQIVFPFIGKFHGWKEVRSKLLQMFITLNQVDDGNPDIKKEISRLVLVLKKEQ
jgi:hypothetical protein